jgi:hypothetical protein
MNKFRAPSIALMIAGVSSALSTQRAAAEPADELPQSTWQFTAGLGAMAMPRFPGSDRTRYLALPMLNVSYGRFFLGEAPGSGSGGGLGVRANEPVALARRRGKQSNHRGTQPEHLRALCRLPLLRSGLPAEARSAKAGAPRLI